MIYRNLDKLLTIMNRVNRFYYFYLKKKVYYYLLLSSSYLIVLGIGYFGLIYQQLANRTAKQYAVIDQQEQLKKLTHYQHNRIIGKEIQKKPSADKQINQITQLATTCQVIIIKLKPSYQEKARQSYQLTVTVTGSYQHLLDFLRAFTQQVNALALTTINLQQTNNQLLLTLMITS